MARIEKRLNKPNAKAYVIQKNSNFSWFEGRPLSDGAEVFREIVDGKVSSSNVVLWP